MIKRQIYLLFAGLLLIYTILTFTAPDYYEVLKKYCISLLQLRLLNQMVVIPIMIIWVLVVYGYVRFRDYARAVMVTLDALVVIYKQVLACLAWGIGIVIIITLVGQYLGSLSETLEKLSLIGIVQLLYAILFIYGFGFYLIARGAKQLKKIKEV